jgi:Protein of unknown function (DUF2971)
MWSHYAHQYQGAVISFDADHEFFADQISVEYVTERPKVPIETYTSGPIPLAELCNKSKEWWYEQEVRIARLLKECKKTDQVDSRGFSVFTAQLPRDGWCLSTNRKSGPRGSHGDGVAQKNGFDVPR